MDLLVPHSVEYEVPGAVSVEEVISTLQANAELIQEIGPLLERLVPGLTVQHIVLRVHKIEAGSLRELFFAALVVAFQEDLKKEVPPLIEKLFGIHVADEYDTIITISVLALVFYGADFLYRATTKNVGAMKLREQFNEMVHELSVTHGIPEKQIRDFFEERYSKPSTIKRLAGAVGRFFRPSKRQSNAPIKVGDRRIESDVVAEVPGDVQIEAMEKIQTSEFVKGVEIELHAKDKDKGTSGWAGTIRGVSDKRLKMLLNAPVKPGDLWGKDVIVGDIMLVKEQKGDAFEPTEFHLTRIIKH